MTYEMIAVFAREKAGLSDAFHMAGWEDFSRDGLDAAKLRFFDVPLITRGKRKGRPNWRVRRNEDEKVVWMSGSEITAAAAEWEKRTGKCSECEGSGKTMLSWNHITGTTYQDCKKCEGNGKSIIDESIAMVEQAEKRISRAGIES